MNLKRRFGLVSVAILTATIVFGQNDFFFNHYMFNPSYYNPGWVGVEKESFLAAHVRAQWVGFQTSFDGSGGAPASQLASIVIPSQGKLSGYGLAISNDQVANVNNLQARFSISYSTDFRFGKISFGLMPGIFSQTLDFSQLRPVEPEPGLPQGKESQVRPDLGAGIWFKSARNYFIGISALNILEPSFDYGVQFLTDSTDLVNAIARNYTLSLGNQIVLSRDLVIRPTLFLRSDLNSYTFEVSGIASYKDKMWGGLSFRRSEAITIMMGYSFLEDNQLRFGYSFDYVVNDREAKQPTSHEFYLRYNLPGLILGGRKAIKTPRFPVSP